MSRALSTPPDSPAPRLSSDESKLYYYGLPSCPVLVARTGTTPWELPSGPEAYPKIKELRVVGNHKIKDVWEDNLALKVHAILDQNKVAWTSTDVVRFGYADEPSGEVIIWIGVEAESVSFELGIDVALECKKMLSGHAINDIDVEIRESVVTRLAGPRLLEPSPDVDPTMEVREPFTPTMGIAICPNSPPWLEGTAGFFLNEGGDKNRLLLASTRHVVLPGSENKTFEHRAEGQRRHDILILNQTSFQGHIDSTQKFISDQDIVFSYHRARVKMVEGKMDNAAIVIRENAQRDLEELEKKVTALEAFKRELSVHWGSENNRILGHVIFSPPIAVGSGTESYTQDIAIIAIDPSKIDPSCSSCNVINLGFKYTPLKLTSMMHPYVKNSHNFTFPPDHLLRLRGTITDYEMRNPTMYGHDGEPCIMVLKCGKTSGLTVGRANNIVSYVRYYGDIPLSGVSKEWAIMPFDHDSGPFSKNGDSGSVVVDGTGRIGGIITGGNKGVIASTDVTYVTPISYIMKVIRSHKKLARAHIK